MAHYYPRAGMGLTFATIPQNVVYANTILSICLSGEHHSFVTPSFPFAHKKFCGKILALLQPRVPIAV